MTVTAAVTEAVQLSVTHQAVMLVVTERDVARGFVIVPGASRLEIGHDGPCVFEFRSTAPVVKSFTVTTPGLTGFFGRDGGTLNYRPRSSAKAPLSIDYHFELAAGARPGTYPWPVTMTVLPQ